MLVAILNDTHAGANGNSEYFNEYQERFYNEIFFPYCKKHEIKKIWHAGDYYYNRTALNVKTLWANRKMFLEPMHDLGMTMDIIPGNHDYYHKNDTKVCSLKETLGYFTSSINIIQKPTVIQYDESRVAWIPWINESNSVECNKFIETQRGKVDLLIAHLEIGGFEFSKGIFCTNSKMTADIFNGYDLVISGHYHHKSHKNNIQYLGAQFEMTWEDCNDAKFFHIFDTQTKKLIAVKNPFTLYERFFYFEDEIPIDVTKFSVKNFKNKFVRVIVVSRNDTYKFNQFIEHLMTSGAHDIKIIEAALDKDSIENIKIESEIIYKKTSLIISDYIKEIQLPSDIYSDRLIWLMNEIHAEALTGSTE